MPLPVRKAVFPVAGLGTRFLPATKAMPKEMLPLVDKPLIQHAVEEAQAAGIDSFIFVTGHGKTPLEDHFDRVPELDETLTRRNKTDALALVRACEIEAGQLAYVRQHAPLGLGHAIWCARTFIGREPFAVILPDDVVLDDTPCLQQMVEAHGEVGGTMMAVTEVPRAHTSRYGILKVGEERGRFATVKGLVEKPEPEAAPSTLAVIGRYILQPEIFDFLGEKRTGAGGEIQLTDGLAQLIGRQPVTGFRFSGSRYDCGNKLGFLEANIAFALARPDMADQVRGMLADMLAGQSAAPRRGAA